MTQNFLDYDYLKKFYKNYDISSYIKKTKKGISVFAKKDIKKGNVVAYYKFKTLCVESVLSKILYEYLLRFRYKDKMFKIKKNGFYYRI